MSGLICYYSLFWLPRRAVLAALAEEGEEGGEKEEVGEEGAIGWEYTRFVNTYEHRKLRRPPKKLGILGLLWFSGDLEWAEEGGF